MTLLPLPLSSGVTTIFFITTLQELYSSAEQKQINFIIVLPTSGVYILSHLSYIYIYIYI